MKGASGVRSGRPDPSAPRSVGHWKERRKRWVPIACALAFDGCLLTAEDPAQNSLLLSFGKWAKGMVLLAGKNLSNSQFFFFSFPFASCFPIFSFRVFPSRFRSD